MSAYTPPDLSQATINVIHDLTHHLTDSKRCLEEAVNRSLDESLRGQLLVMARERAVFLDELQQHLRTNGIEPQRRATLGGTVRLAWMEFQSSLPGEEQPSVISDVVATEQRLVDRYARAIEEVDGSPIATILKRQQECALFRLDFLEADAGRAK